ncbi:2-dehydro-3-deoxygalactonokinase [Paracoccus stylophorae]|uniref:2-dehydro-3-deoxygalactonokinase n=1 Tax=Paracoccus stylophorae TaxID=659350 RepID=UPI002350879D|nr:2-dehydro-3-deoxygalactonokinase [Paracoccus stylophorae]
MTTPDCTAADWIAADWDAGTLRLWAMRGDQVVDSRASDDGTDGLAGDDFAAVLTRMTEGWADAPVVACGTVGAADGLARIACASVPATVDPRPVQVPGRRVWIVGGLTQADPPDLMQGDETRIAGLLAARPQFDGTLCLPGAQTRWARISASEVVSFQTFLTGEMFDLLSRQSVLRHAVGTPGDIDAFDAAVSDALSQPHRAYGRLFQLHARAQLGGLQPETAGATLSGTLIGWELAGARPYWLGQEVCVIGAPARTAPYARALAQQGVTCTEGDGTAATLAGLGRAFRAIADAAAAI